MKDLSASTFKNTVLLLSYRAIAVLGSFFLLRAVVQELDKEQYGVWVTISSIVSWLTFFDLGLGNSLRNKLSTAFDRKDLALFTRANSTVYLLLGMVAAGILLVTLPVCYLLNWQALLKTSVVGEQDLFACVSITLATFATKLVADNIYVLLSAVHRTAVNGFANAFSAAVTYGLYVWLANNYHLDLLQSILILTGVPLVTSLAVNIYFYAGPYRRFLPSPGLYDQQLKAELFGLGLRFFILQLCSLIIFTTDNFIVTQLYGPAETATYSIAFRYFSVLQMLFGILLTPIWPAVAVYFGRGDSISIRKTMRKLLMYWLAVSATAACFYFAADKVYLWWLGSAVQIPALLNAGMAAFIIISSWNALFAVIINGIGKIRVQYYSAIISALLNIPMSLFFARTLQLGAAGIILGTSCCLLVTGSWLAPLQVYKLCFVKPKGIWNQ